MRKNIILRLFSLLLIVLMIGFAIVGCKEESTENSDEIVTEQEDEQLEGFDPQNNYIILKYENSENGKLEGELEQRIARGATGSVVKAVADEGYIFAGWSDGFELEVRRDKNVEENITVSPKFVKIGSTFSVRYDIKAGNRTLQSVKRTGKAGETVNYLPAKEPPVGYKYGNWSDGEKGGNRYDTVVSDGKRYVLELVPTALSIPAIEINTSDGTGVIDRENYKSCDVRLWNTDEEYCFEDVDAQIRGRGNSSWNYPKKGFRLKFDKKRSMLGSDYEAKTWIFISNYGDKALMRNMIAYDMSELFSGLDYTVMHEYIDVFIDGHYCGMYMMTDQIDVAEGKLELDDRIYEDPSKMAYILEVGDTNPGKEGVDNFKVEGDFNRRYSINYPETDDPSYDPDVHLKYIKDYVYLCLETINGDDWEKVCELIDVDSFIDHYIIQELFMNKDGFWRSIYFYKEPNGKLYAGPVWDFDQGAGNVDGFFGSGKYETTPDIDIEYEMSGYGGKEAGVPWVAGVSMWYKALFEFEEFEDMVRERLGECGPLIMQALEKATTDGSVADSYYMLYSDAMKRNFEQWKIMGQKIWPNTPKVAEIKTVKGQIDYMREWLIERYDVLCKFYGVY